MLPSPPYLMHILAGCSLLRHQASLKDEPQSPATAKATLQHTPGPAAVSTSVWPPEARLPQAIVNSAGRNKTTAIISPFKNSHTTLHEQGEKGRRQVLILPVHSIHLALSVSEQQLFYPWAEGPAPPQHGCLHLWQQGSDTFLQSIRVSWKRNNNQRFGL